MTMTREEAVRLWPQAVADALGVPVFLASHGPRALDKRVLGVASCC
jgi:hypothetical protein